LTDAIIDCDVIRFCEEAAAAYAFAADFRVRVLAARAVFSANSKPTLPFSSFK
jgi:hypothetical protein